MSYLGVSCKLTDFHVMFLQVPSYILAEYIIPFHSAPLI